MIEFEETGEPNSYIIRGTGSLTPFKQKTDAIKFDIRGFDSTEFGCFQYCPNLVNVTFDDNLITINNGITFKTRIEYFTIPKNVKYLLEQPFDNNIPLIRIFVHPENQYFCDIDGIVYSKDLSVLWVYPGNHGESIVIIPDFVQILEVAAIGLSNTIKYVKIPKSVKIIKHHQFHLTYSIEYIDIMNKQGDVILAKDGLLSNTNKPLSLIHFNPPIIITNNCLCNKLFHLSFSELFVFITV